MKTLPNFEQRLNRIVCTKREPKELVNVLVGNESVVRKIDAVKGMKPGTNFRRLIKKLFNSVSFPAAEVLGEPLVRVINQQAS